MYGNRTSGEIHRLLMDEYTAIFGYSHLLGGFAGGQAAFVRVPLGDINLLKIPDNVPDEEGRCGPCVLERLTQPEFLSNTALYLSDVLCTSYHTVKITKVHKGKMVAIWGMGPIGVMVAFFAFKEGANV